MNALVGRMFRNIYRLNPELPRKFMHEVNQDQLTEAILAFVQIYGYSHLCQTCETCQFGDWIFEAMRAMPTLQNRAKNGLASEGIE